MTGLTRNGGKNALAKCHRCGGVWIFEIRKGGQQTAQCRHCGQQSDLQSGKTARDPQTQRSTQKAWHVVYRRSDDQHALIELRSRNNEKHTDLSVVDHDLQTVPEVPWRAEDVDEALNVHTSYLDALTKTDTPDESTDDTTSDAPGAGRTAHVPIADHPVLDPDASPPDRTRGIHILGPGTQLNVAGLQVSKASPSIRDWLPEFLEQLVPISTRLTADYVEATAPDRSVRQDRPNDVAQELLLEDVFELDDLADQDPGAHAEVTDYVYQLARASLEFANADPDDLAPQYHDQIDAALQALTTIGTGRGSMNAGRSALGYGPVALHSLQEAPQPVTLSLDGSSWTNANPETVETCLETLSVLSEAFDIRLVMSPQVYGVIRDALQRVRTRPQQSPDWLEHWTDLTEPTNYSRATQPPQADENDNDPKARAWEWLSDRTDGEGRLRLIDALDVEDPVPVKSLKEDRDVALSASSVDVYVPELERDGLVHVDRSGRYNSLTLSEIGAAVVTLLNPDCSIRDPAQSRLTSGLTATPQRFASAVYAPYDQDGGRQDGNHTAEGWLADTGDPYERGFQQWLGKAHHDDPSKQPYQLTKRQLAPARDGVTLVDEPIRDWTNPTQAPNGDGRVTYLGAMEDEIVVVTQYGGPVVTLGRLGAALLSDRVLAKILNPDSIGEQFELVDDVVLEDFVNDLFEVWRRGRQIGWFSEDEAIHWGNWRERIGEVRSGLLAKLGRHQDLDAGLRNQLFKDLHGFLASATSLLDAAGYDVHLQLRLPRSGELLRNEDALEDFLDFFEHTVPKQAGYRDENGFHSFHRMTIEDRPHKLRSRLSYDIDEGRPTADLTATWSVVGPNATLLQDEIRAAIESATHRVRDPIAEGTEDAAVLQVPVRIGGTRPHLRSIVREWSQRKGFDRASRCDLDRLVDVLEVALSTRDRNPSPMDVTEALLQLEQRSGREQLHPGAIARVIGRLPADRILPSLPPSARQMAKAVLEAPGEVTRQELIALTSENSVDRHWRKLVATDLVERDEDGGFRLWLEPWWSPRSERDPIEEGLGDGLLGEQARWQEVLYEATIALRPDVIDGTLFTTPVDLDEVLAAAPELEWLLPILEAIFDIHREDIDEDPAVRDDSMSFATIGRPPRELASDQQSLPTPAD